MIVIFTMFNHLFTLFMYKQSFFVPFCIVFSLFLVFLLVTISGDCVKIFFPNA